MAYLWRSSGNTLALAERTWARNRESPPSNTHDLEPHQPCLVCRMWALSMRNTITKPEPLARSGPGTTAGSAHIWVSAVGRFCSHIPWPLDRRSRFTGGGARYPGENIITPCFEGFLDELYERQNELGSALMIAFAEMFGLERCLCHDAPAHTSRVMVELVSVWQGYLQPAFHGGRPWHDPVAGVPGQWRRARSRGR